MNEQNEKKYVPVQPFDVTKSETFYLYDNFPYVRDINLIGDGSIAKDSGNIIKYYRCDMAKPVKFGGD